MTPEQIKRIQELNVAYSLDGGGYSFEEPPAALEGLGAVVWADPDPDYVPWIQDGDYGDFYGVQCPLYVFAPNSGHFSQTEFPPTYMDGDSKYVLLTHRL